jgi:carbon-monoxide dehydrogenase large subunit
MEIRFDPSGAVTILSGAFSHGQGHETVFTQLICDRLGLEPKDVRHISGDTDKVFFGIGTGGSRTATIAGAALHCAAEKIVTKAKCIAAHALDADPAEVSFKDGLFSAPRSNQSLSIREIAKLASGGDLPDGVEPGLAATHVYQHKIYNYPNGSHVCELEIDEETGEVEITRYFVVDDVGTVMNPLLLQGQIIGGLAQGLGQVLKEDIRWDAESGQLLTGSFMDYAMPRAGDFSTVITQSNPVPTKTNPLGVKGAGEAGTVGALPAVANAIVDALSEFGVRHVPMPATAERLWRIMQEARAAAQR